MEPRKRKCIVCGWTPQDARVISCPKCHSVIPPAGWSTADLDNSGKECPACGSKDHLQDSRYCMQCGHLLFPTKSGG